MDKDYIEVKIPILDSVDEMKVVKTFTQEQLWYVCAIAKAFEKSEQQVKKQKEVIDKAIEFLYKIKFDKTDKYICISEYIEYQQLLDILNEVSE
jgi:hypothetical protein